MCDRVNSWGEKKICEKCSEKIEWVLGKTCIRCGKPISEEQTYCDDCNGKRTNYISGHACAIYNRDLKESIARFKFGGRPEYGEVFADMLFERYGQWLLDTGAELLIPVPVHKSKMQQRGYNQAERIASRLSEKTGIPMADNLLIRKKKTLPQKELDAKERKKNLSEAFATNEDVVWLYQNTKYAIIIDDIFTTGNTIDCCASVLSEIGIANIYFLCVAIGKGA